MRIAFLGTPLVAVPALTALVAARDIDVAAVVTNPDRPKGRSRTPVPPPVKEAALDHGLRVLQPAKPIEIVDELRELDLDACAVVAYGALLPRAVLEAGGKGFVNLHFSLLPRWRGAAPVQHAIRAGDEVTGVTTFVLDEGMDTGPVIDRVEVPIGGDESAGSLLGRLAAIGSDVLVDSIRALVRGTELTPQDDDQATLAPKITAEDVAIDWEQPATRIRDLVRSANPAPGAHTTFDGKRLKVWRARTLKGDGRPGEVLSAGPTGVAVATGDGAVLLDEVQPEGKGRMDGGAFANGYQPEVGSRLGS
ncbi:MAG: methionyl-tRNA formyltransferase [Actinobacteria bacterium]|nr:methionyl-tRNA formyltransferase [Actinomycetota bacterium]